MVFVGDSLDLHALLLSWLQLKLTTCDDDEPELEVLCTILEEVTDFFITACDVFDRAPSRSVLDLDHVIFTWKRCVDMVGKERVYAFFQGNTKHLYVP